VIEMKDIEKRLEAVCRQVGALWEREKEEGRYLLWKGGKFAELCVHPISGDGYEFDLFGVATEVVSSDSWREIRKQIVEFFS
jgi:hypothetical protein